MDITLTATVDAQRLSAALRSVLPHLAKGKGFPEPLYGVGLTFDGEELCAQGSDGQTMAVHRIPAVPAIETGAAVWTAESAKAVMTWAKGLEGDVVIDGTALTCGEARIAVELMDCQYPNVVGIVEKWSHRPAAPAGHDGAYVVGIDPALLAGSAAPTWPSTPTTRATCCCCGWWGRAHRCTSRSGTTSQVSSPSPRPFDFFELDVGCGHERHRRTT